MKMLTILLSFLLLIPANTVHADDVPAAEIAIIKRAGAPAPFSGVLYSDLAYAEQKAKIEQMQLRFDETLQFKLDLQRLKLNFATSTTAIALSAERQKNQELSRQKDEQINVLTKQLIEANENSQSSMLNNALWMLFGAAMVATGGLVYAATSN